MATVKTAFLGVPDGEIYPKAFEPGDEVTGDLAAVAVREGWATEEKSSKPPENKARKAAPENKGA
jgi:hypothetical protein